MLLDQVSESQLRAAQIVSGAAMITLIAAPMFGRQAQVIRLIVTVAYIGVLLGFLGYFAFSR